MAEGEEKAADAGKGGKGKLLIIAIPAVLMLVAAAMMFMKGGSSGAPAAPAPSPSPVAGAVVAVDPITINLANGHFLKLGMSLQATAAAGEEVSGAKALDLAIELFSGKPVDELATKNGREKLKEELLKEVEKAYEDEVFDIYFTTFVFQ